MNKIRRKNLQSIIDQLEELKGSLEDLQAEEEEYRDNIPENMQESERYEKADEARSEERRVGKECRSRTTRSSLTAWTRRNFSPCSRTPQCRETM